MIRCTPSCCKRRAWPKRRASQPTKRASLRTPLKYADGVGLELIVLHAAAVGLGAADFGGLAIFHGLDGSEDVVGGLLDVVSLVGGDTVDGALVSEDTVTIDDEAVRGDFGFKGTTNALVRVLDNGAWVVGSAFFDFVATGIDDQPDHALGDGLLLEFLHLASVVELLHGRAAWVIPFEDNGLALEVGEADGLAVEGLTGEVRSSFADVSGRKGGHCREAGEEGGEDTHGGGV